MTHNNKLAQAKRRPNTQRCFACAPFLRAAKKWANNQGASAALTLLAQAELKPNT